MERREAKSEGVVQFRDILVLHNPDNMSLFEHSVDGDNSVSPEFPSSSTTTTNVTFADCSMENADAVVLSATTDSEHVSCVNVLLLL